MKIRDKMTIKKIMFSAISGMIALMLSGFSLNLDNIYSVKLIWSMIFPAMIFTIWEPAYGVLSVLCGPVFSYAMLDPEQGFVNVMLAGLLVLWAALNSYFRDREQRKPWYFVYLLQIPYAFFYVFVNLLLFRKVLYWNHLYSFSETIRFISGVYVKVHVLNGVMSIFMVIAVTQLLQQLPWVRRLYGIKLQENDSVSYRYFANAILFVLGFSCFDAWMDTTYSLSRGIHLSFLKLSTGENIKVSMIIFLVCVVTHYCIVTERQRREANHQILMLNDELERKVIQRTEELKQAYDDLESYSYTVSHELKSPIREIEAYIEVIEEDSEEVLSSQSKKDMAQIKQICEDTVFLVGQMMNYSKVGYAIMDIQPIDMGALIRVCISEMEKSYTNVKMDYHIEELPTIMGDPFLIRIAMFNILSNSYKFTSKTELPRIDIWSRSCGDYYEIYIKDNGVGFQADYDSKLFQTFNRLHDESEYEGKGIGLATVKKIMNRHFGDVKIMGEKDRGCVNILVFRKDSPHL